MVSENSKREWVLFDDWLILSWRDKITIMLWETIMKHIQIETGSPSLSSIV